MRIKIILAITILLAMACKMDEHRWTIIESHGLNAYDLHFYTLLFCNKETGFIGGHLDETTENPRQNSDTFVFVKSNALIYKTTDAGKNWKGTNLGEGEISNIIRKDDTLYAIKISDEDHHTEIFLSNDTGKNWSKKYLFPSVVADLFFINGKTFIIGKDEDWEFQFYVLADDQEHWKKLTAPSLPIIHFVTRSNEILYISGTAFQSILIDYNIVNNTSRVIELPKDFKCYYMAGYNDQVKMCGLKDNHIMVCSVNKNNKITEVYSYSEKERLFPFGFYPGKNEDIVIVGRRRSFDVGHKIIETKDNGKTWQVLNFERDNFIDPFYFFNNNDTLTAWFYSGSGKFQVLE